MAEKFQIHASALDTICWAEFQRKAINGERAPKSAALIVGTATHASISANMGNRITEGSPVALDVATDVARDTASGEWDSGVMLDEEYAEMGLAAAKAEVVDAATTLAALHYTDVAPTIEPVHSDRAFVLDIEGMPIQLAGTMDIQERARIRDTKTKRASPPKDTAAKSIQLTAYHLAAKTIDGVAPAEVGLDFLVKTKTPKSVSQMSTREDANYAEMFARVRMINRMLETGIFPPVAGDHWKCSQAYCPFHGTCEFARRPVTVAAA